MRGLILIAVFTAPAFGQFRPILRVRPMKRVVMTSSGTLSIPANSHRVYARLWGAGGGAGGSASVTSAGIETLFAGGPGGGGGYASADFSVTGFGGSTLLVLVGAPGLGGPTRVRMGVSVGRGGSGGSGTGVFDNGGNNPYLIAGGGAGGGGAGTAAGGGGGAGGAGGYAAGASGSRGCAGANCGNAGAGGSSSGGAAGVPQNNCSPPAQPSTAGKLYGDVGWGNEGGNAGACFTPPIGQTLGNGTSYYDVNSGWFGCSSGAGGGGRAGGGGGGVVTIGGPHCAGGGGGSGYFRPGVADGRFVNGATGSANAPALLNDTDLSVTSGGIATVYATGGLANVYTDSGGAASGKGSNGTGGLAVFYFY